MPDVIDNYRRSFEIVLNHFNIDDTKTIIPEKAMNHHLAFKGRLQPIVEKKENHLETIPIVKNKKFAMIKSFVKIDVLHKDVLFVKMTLIGSVTVPLRLLMVKKKMQMMLLII